MTPETTRRSGRRDAAIGVVLFGALVVLAVLQYRWIGQVSEADRDRLQRGLSAAVNRFAQDVDGEIERLAQALLGGANAVRDDAELAARLESWKSVARYPGLVKQATFREPDELVVQRRGRGGPGRGGPFVIAGEAGPVVIVPDRRPDPEDTPRAVAIELDGAAMKETWLPELVARDFGPEYHVRVRGPQGVFYETANAPEQIRESERARVPLFVLRGGPGRGKGGGPPKGKDFGAGKEFRGGDFNADFKDKGGEFKNKGKGPPPGEFNDAWRVEATYQSGAMSDLVENLRVRNLAVSFGILLLMGVSVGLLMWSTRRANALARQQMEFVAGVTHELRTPLAVILSASENLADGVASGPEQTQRYGGVIRAQTKRLSSMVEQVLRFAGLSSQHGEIHRAAVGIHEVVAEAVTDTQPELALAGCTLRQEVAESLPEMQGDRAALLHCLRNLLINAAKHAPGSNVTLRVQADGAGTLEIAVEDGGPGFEPADVPHLFEPFYRGGRAKDDQVQGSGLGLSLVKKIAEAHGGKVEAANRAEGGAMVRMLLPLRGTRTGA